MVYYIVVLHDVNCMMPMTNPINAIQHTEVLSLSCIYIYVLNTPCRYVAFQLLVHIVQIASLNIPRLDCALHICPYMDSAHSILPVHSLYTPRTLPVDSLYTPCTVYRENTGSVRGVYTPRILFHVHSPYAPFHLIVSSVNGSESRCFPEQIT